MKISDFYEKHWNVNGEPVPPLTEEEKLIWDVAEELGVSPYIKIWKRKFGWQYIVNPIVQEHIGLNQ